MHCVDPMVVSTFSFSLFEFLLESIIPLLVQLIDQPILVFGPGTPATAAVGRELVVAFSAGEAAGAGGGGDDENVLLRFRSAC